MKYFEFNLHERNVPDVIIGRGSASIRIGHATGHDIVFGLMIFYVVLCDAK